MKGARLRLVMVCIVRRLEVDGRCSGWESRRTVGMLFEGRCGTQIRAVERWVKEKACADGAYWPKLIGQKRSQTCM